MRKTTLLDRVKSSEFTAVLVIVVLSGLFQMINPNFLSHSNIVVMLRSTGYVGIVTVGIALCLISGLIDVSIGASVGLVSCAFGWVIVVQGWDLIPALLVAGAVGLAASMVNVTIILRTQITSFISTVAMAYTLRGFAYLFSDGSIIYPIPESMSYLGRLKPLGVSVPFVIFIGCVVIAELMLRYTVWGLEVRATGSDRKIAFDTGVRVDFVNYSCFAVLGLLGAVAGIPTVKPGAGNRPGLLCLFKGLTHRRTNQVPPAN